MGRSQVEMCLIETNQELMPLIAFISDIHGNSAVLEAVLDDIKL